MKLLRKLLKTGSPRTPPPVVHQKKRSFAWKQQRKRNPDSDETSSTEGSGMGCSRTVDLQEGPLPLPWQAGNFLENGRPPTEEADWWQTDDEDDDIDAPQTRRFVNRGLVTWNKGRKVWKEGTKEQPDRPRHVIPDSFRRDLVKCLSDRRQFELSQRIPLSTMIEAYQEVWKSNE